MADEQVKPRATTESHALDVLALLGLLLIAVGCWMAWRPAGLFVPGALILLFTASAARRERQQQDRQAQREAAGRE